MRGVVGWIVRGVVRGVVRWIVRGVVRRVVRWVVRGGSVLGGVVGGGGG